MKTLIKLSTVDLQVNGENEKGLMNITKTSMTWKNLNFKQLFGDKLYNDHNFFSMKLMNVINNTALINNNPTTPSVYFTFENTNGTTIYNDGDYANYNNGTSVGDVVIATSNKKNGTYSALFNQTANTGVITIPNWTFTTANGGITFSMWFNLTTASAAVTLYLFYSNGFRIFLRYGNTINFQSYMNGFYGNSATLTMTTNTWYHLCITYANNGDATIYVNNVSLNVTRINAPNNNILINNNGIGNNPTALNTGVGPQCYIDDFRMYNLILSDNERGWVYTNIFPVDLNYLDNNTYFQINASGVPFVNRGFGKAPLALCRLTQTDNSIISDNEVILNKPNEIGSLTLELVDVFANAIGAKLLSDTSFIIQIEGY
jgi:hypothetical protein